MLIIIDLNYFMEKKKFSWYMYLIMIIHVPLILESCVFCACQSVIFPSSEDRVPCIPSFDRSASNSLLRNPP